jgi:hypothetical protein
MGGRIMTANGLIEPPTYNLVFTNDDRTHGHLIVRGCFLGKPQSNLHPLFGHQSHAIITNVLLDLLLIEECAECAKVSAEDRAVITSVVSQVQRAAASLHHLPLQTASMDFTGKLTTNHKQRQAEMGDKFPVNRFSILVPHFRVVRARRYDQT